MTEGDTLKLFVWEGFCPDYTDGLAFAIAETVQMEFPRPPEDI